MKLHTWRQHSVNQTGDSATTTPSAMGLALIPPARQDHMDSRATGVHTRRNREGLCHA
jgi:hypothetical protein